jgi:hypothetical protein
MASKYRVTLENLLDLVDVLIADYNGMATTALYNRSPLDYLRVSVDQKRFFIRQIPESQRGGFSMTEKRTVVTVRGNLKKGVRPFIRFEGVRYFSERLGNMASLIGQQVVVECNTRDLRTLRLYQTNGPEIDTVTAARVWAHQPHDLRMRKAILQCIRQAAEAMKSKKPRNELAHALRVKRQQPKTFPEPQKQTEEAVLRKRTTPLIKMPRLIVNY